MMYQYRRTMKPLNSFIKDTGTLISGNVLAQGIAFLAYLLLTRLYTPDDFGTFSIFYSYIEVLIILSTCKYELATVIAKDDQEASDIAHFTLRMNALFSLLLLIVITILYFCKALPVETQSIGLIALLIPFMVFFCGSTRVYASLFNRYKRYQQIAAADVVTSASGAGLKILMGVTHYLKAPWALLHAVGLPLGTVLGQAGGWFFYRCKLRRLSSSSISSSSQETASPSPSSYSNVPPSFSSQLSVAKKFRNFPLFTAPKDFVNSFSGNLPFLWLALYFDKAEVGLFLLALTFTFRPVNILNGAFERVLYANISEKVRQHLPVRHDVLRFMCLLNVVALPIFIVGFIWCEPIFVFLFGSKWVGTGFYVRCMLPWVYVMLTSTSLMCIANIFSKQRTEFAFYLVLLVLRVAAMIVGIHYMDFKMAILLFTLSGALVSLALLVWYLIQIRSYEKRIGLTE